MTSLKWRIYEAVSQRTKKTLLPNSIAFAGSLIKEYNAAYSLQVRSRISSITYSFFSYSGRRNSLAVVYLALHSLVLTVLSLFLDFSPIQMYS